MYYYLIASLPTLSLDTPPALTLEEFKETCRMQISPEDYAALESVLDINSAPAGNNTFAAAWHARETQLRNAAARQRAHRRKQEAVEWLRAHPGFDTRIEEKVENACALPNPLEREKALDSLRWELLDELAGTNPFSTARLMAYAIKLQLAERRASLDPQLGHKKISEAIAPTESKEIKKNED